MRLIFSSKVEVGRSWHAVKRRDAGGFQGDDAFTSKPKSTG
jgi:hypothetical protein